MDELLSGPGVAALLNVSTQRVYQLAATLGFPAPAETMGMGGGRRYRRWRRVDIEKWAAEEWNHQPGPRKERTPLLRKSPD